ncbi:DHH family phosphoesterase [Edaphobacillus lindanitolerans]|uniref:Cyclic-di-AMP phosphodiesterase n=1 Tax=Edaphobacillus lindanitolerans TaxID=550447 RepID=A0A1U7PMZ1_9BACI|nr:DHH family phosphoesterase [Edaphobacillus lindanitolerans]SIT87084.1 c-di-AMP phosphodiesterase, consists of a GGDEF-like and DHH domains [Edaphobacillus lindanitolerans]
MGTFFRQRPIRIPLLVLTVIAAAAVVPIWAYREWAGVLFAVVAAAALAAAWRMEEKTYKETERHIENLSYRMKKVGEEALLEMPIGILLVDDRFTIEWANPFMTQLLEYDTLIGEELSGLSEDFRSFAKEDAEHEGVVSLGNRKYKVVHKPEEKLFYLFDITEQLEIETLYYADRTVLGMILVDNYDELASGMDDQTKSRLNSLVTTLINDWGAEYGIYVKRFSSDRFLAVLNESILHELEKDKFRILDAIREETARESSALTLSVGIGADSGSLPELGELAQSGLDLVLGRGGDQVAIKQPSGRVKFYGGKTNPVEKRTRVRARVISHALRDLIQESDKVIVMGHKLPDMDAIGASVGVRRMAQMNNVEGYVVIDFDELDPSVTRLMEQIRSEPDLFRHFITPDEAHSLITERTLLVIVDTHKPSFVIEERLLQKAEKTVVIDHHRRGEEFIEDTLLVYMEPYASSTAELITELLEYQPKGDRLSMLEATSMLAGIIVDTKSFTLRTGSRTFEAASYLRSNGADTVLIQRFMREDIATYLERADIIRTVEFFGEGIVIAHGEDGEPHSPVLIAQTADTLLTMKGVNASFVVADRPEGRIGISARSLGDLNVQVITERLGGGGHLTNAAAQLEAGSIAEALSMLKEAINESTEGGTDQ